jgi:hypothetical protein
MPGDRAWIVTPTPAGFRVCWSDAKRPRGQIDFGTLQHRRAMPAREGLGVFRLQNTDHFLLSLTFLTGLQPTLRNCQATRLSCYKSYSKNWLKCKHK